MDLEYTCGVVANILEFLGLLGDFLESIPHSKPLKVMGTSGHRWCRESLIPRNGPIITIFTEALGDRGNITKGFRLCSWTIDWQLKRITHVYYILSAHNI